MPRQRAVQELLQRRLKPPLATTLAQHPGTYQKVLSSNSFRWDEQCPCRGSRNAHACRGLRDNLRRAGVPHVAALAPPTNIQGGGGTMLDLGSAASPAPAPLVVLRLLEGRWEESGVWTRSTAGHGAQGPSPPSPDQYPRVCCTHFSSAGCGKTPGSPVCSRGPRRPPRRTSGSLFAVHHPRASWVSHVKGPLRSGCTDGLFQLDVRTAIYTHISLSPRFLSAPAPATRFLPRFQLVADGGTRILP